MTEDLRGTAYPNGSDQHPRSYICNADVFDTVGVQTFWMLFKSGLREWHHVLDVGCGCLRVGKLLIPWLLPGRYCGLEPNVWLVEEGIGRELGTDILKIKQPMFSADDNFSLLDFGRRFDYIFAHSIMTHASWEQVVTFMTNAAGVIKPDGVVLATFNFGEPTGNEGWTYPKTVDHDHDELMKLCDGLGLWAVMMDRALWNDLGQQWMMFFRDFDAFRQARPWVKIARNDEES